MASSLRLFVSHSSKDNAFTKEVCDRLENQGGQHLQLLVDLVSLEDGSPWPLQLHEMMADCHAALVLLTPRAVASDWVLKEMTILSWRQSFPEARFKLFVAQDPSLTAAELAAARFTPLQHRQLQGIKSLSAPEIAGRVLAAIAADAVLPAETPSIAWWMHWPTCSET